MFQCACGQRSHIFAVSCRKCGHVITAGAALIFVSIIIVLVALLYFIQTYFIGGTPNVKFIAD